MAWTLAAASTPTTAGASRDSSASRRQLAWGLRARAAGVNLRERESRCIVEDLTATALAVGVAARPRRVRARVIFGRAIGTRAPVQGRVGKSRDWASSAESVPGRRAGSRKRRDGAKWGLRRNIEPARSRSTEKLLAPARPRNPRKLIELPPAAARVLRVA